MKLLKKQEKKETETKSKKSKKKTIRATSMGRFWMYSFIVTAIMFVAIGYSITMQLGGLAEDVYKRNVEGITFNLPGQMEEMFYQYAGVLGSQVKDPELAQVLNSADPELIEQKEQALRYVFPDAIRIKLFLAGKYDLDDSIKPALGYACISMLQNSESSGQAIAAEVHVHGTPNQHIDLVRRIYNASGQTVGNLMVTYGIDSVKNLMKRLKFDAGYLELRQITKQGAVVVMATRGNQKLKQDGPANQIDIKGTHLKLAYWPEAGADLFTGDNLIIYWGTFGIALILIAVFSYLFYWSIGRHLHKDQVTIITIMKDMDADSVADRYPVHLKNCHGLIGQLTQMARDFTGKAKVRGKTSGGNEVKETAAPEESQEEQLADLTFSADALEVQEISSADESSLPATIFRAYDIRGIVGDTITPEIVKDIGRAIGSEAAERGQQKIVVGRDGRLSGPDLNTALIAGLKQSGRTVIDVGCIPTPVLYFATHYLGNGSGVMLTGSHNPPEYNGMKIMLGGETLHDDSIQALRARIEDGNLIEGEGEEQTVDVAPSYLDRIISDVRLERPLKVVVDCGNGVAGEIAPQLYKMLGCDVQELYCDIDGTFPNHHPDPSKPENLIALTRAVSENKADIGFAFDGDGDRLGVVDSSGKIIWPDRQLMIMAIDVLKRQPGAQIIYDVKCTRFLEQVISEHGGAPLMWKTGHSFIKAKMQETGAQLAGEMSGHIFFKERWFGFDDALYAGARLLEILAAQGESSNKVFSALPDSVSTPELNLLMSEGQNFELMTQLAANAKFAGAKLITIDGVRVEFDDGWGLVRASNTTPSLVFRFEADDAEILSRIQDDFRQQLHALNPDLDLPF